jgi:hypothetical protein
VRDVPDARGVEHGPGCRYQRLGQN